MIIQLTEIGVQLLNETKKPLNIKKYKLGSQVNYALGPSTKDIRGTTVYEGEIADYAILNANVVKYQIGLDFTVGDFSFGEFGLYTAEDQCVAVGVDTEKIEKLAYVSKDKGNAVTVDVYLQMLDGNYTIWTDALKPGDNTQKATVVQSVDHLPPVSASGSNLYIVAPVNYNQADTLAYTSNTGLWAFDNYAYENTHDFTITSCTPTAIVIDTRGFEAERLVQLQPAYTGQIILEILSGSNISICRTISHFVIGNGTSTISFNTPLAVSSKAGDRVRVYSRQKLSITDTVLPIATTESLGAVIVGDGLSITPEGLLSADFPVTSVNGQFGDVQLAAGDIIDIAQVAVSNDYNDLDNRPDQYVLPIASHDTLGGVMIPRDGDFNISLSGEISLKKKPVLTVNNYPPDHSGNVQIRFENEIEGLITPVRLPEQTDLNKYTYAGLFYGSATDINTWQNRPNFEFTSDVTLEVVPIYNDLDVTNCVQRITTNNRMFTRIRSNSMWQEWCEFYTDRTIPIATKTRLGLMSVGQGLNVEDGHVNADVLTVFGKTGDIDLTTDEWFEVFKTFLDIPKGMPQLTPDETDYVTEDNPEYEEYKYARVHWRQLTYGGMYFAGTWNPELNECTDTSAQKIKGLPKFMKLLPGGDIQWLPQRDMTSSEDLELESSYVTFNAKGWLFEVTNTASFTLDNVTRWNKNDFALSTGKEWVRLYGHRSFLRVPENPDTGVLAYREEDRKIFSRQFASPTNTLAIDQTLNVEGTMPSKINFDLADSGITAGVYANVTVDRFGRVTAADNVIHGGTF